MSIKLSKKHGLNPTMNVCFYCGETKELLLLGRLKNDEEAPRTVCTDLEPCDNCKEKFQEGILLIEVFSKTDTDTTGNYWLVSSEAVNSKEILTKGKAFITIEDAKELGLYGETNGN